MAETTEINNSYRLNPLFGRLVILSKVNLSTPLKENAGTLSLGLPVKLTDIGMFHKFYYFRNILL